MKLRDEFGDRLSIFSVSYDDSASAVRGFFEKKSYAYPVVMDARMGGVTGELYQVGGIPTLFLITSEGTVFERRVGFEAGEGPELRRAVERLLAAS